MSCICEQMFCLRICVIVLAAMMFVGRIRGSTRGESDSDVPCRGPFALLFVRFLCDNSDDVALSVRVH